MFENVKTSEWPIGDLPAEGGSAAVLQFISQAIGLLVIAVSGIVLVGWMFDIRPLKSIAAGWATMKPNTALAFISLGVSLIVARREIARPNARHIRRVCAAFAVLIGMLTMTEHIFGWNLGIDQLMFSELSVEAGHAPLGRMSPAAACGFLLLGSALILLHVRARLYWLVQTVAVLVAFGGLLALIGYLFGVSSIYTSGPFRSMALHSATMFILVGVGVLCLRPARGIAALMISDSAGGSVARRLLPVALVVPVFVGWLRLAGQNAGLYDTKFGLTIYAFTNVVVLIGVILWCAGSLRKKDVQRKHAEAGFRQVVESTPSAMVMVNRAGRIALVNRQTEKLFGYTRQELLGQEAQMIVPAHFRQNQAGCQDSFFSNPEVAPTSAEGDLFGRRKDGSEFPVQIGLNPIQTDEGMFALGAIVDITERKRTEGHLQFKTLFEAIPGLFVVLTPQLRIVAASDPYLRATMTVREEILGRGLFEVFPDVDSNAAGGRNLRASLERVNQNRTPDTMAVIRYDLCRPEAMGGGMEERHWSTVNSPVFDANGHVAYIIVRVEDVTEIINKNSGLEQDPHSANSGTSSKRLEMEISLRGQELERLNQQFREANDSLQAEIVERKNAEHNAAAFSQQLEQSNHDLQTVNQELEAFSYSVSHDLRAPLRAIDGFSRILIKEYADAMPAEAREYLEDVRTNTQQMGHLVDDLLAFSRLGRQPVNKQLVQPARVARQCFDDLIVQQPRRRVEIQIGALAPCSADVTLLKQVWTNLISNALKYTASRDVPIIEIGGLSENSSGEQTYFVKDNGVGFDMKYSNKLFGVFQRLHRAEDYEGTGVGLAIVQRIIHRHGGRVWAEAQPEKGATFYFTLQAEETQNA